MKSQRAAFALIALALAFTTACGSDNKDPKTNAETTTTSGNNGARPSEADAIKTLAGTNALVPRKVTSDEAKCVAKLVVDSDLSDSAVRALVDKNYKFKASAKDLRILKALDTKYNKECLS